jgi:DNA-binding PadR family transcriptional regulator
MPPKSEPKAKLPSPREIELLRLVIQERTGREVAMLYQEETGERMPYGTLYTAFAEMEKRGWVRIHQETEGDRRVRRIKIAPAGGAALRRASEEYARLHALARGAWDILKAR